MNTNENTTHSPRAADSALPNITRGMRLEWRVRDASTPKQPGCRAHSRCLVSADGAEIATIANEAADDVRAAIAKAEGRAA